jgi:hypothetical protein
VHHVESRRETNTTESQNLVRDLKRQLAERDLTLSILQEQMKVVEKERDSAIMAKDSLVNSHASEIAVSW